jgi:Ca-activated chloride channel family protein
MANEVLLSSALSKEYVAVTGQHQLLYVLMEIKPSEVMAMVQMPLNLSLVLDTSGSMGGSKLKRLKEAVKYVIDLLDPDDFISIIEFSNRAHTLIGCQRIGSQAQKEKLKSKIDKLKAQGGTNMAPAMKAGLQEVKKEWSANRINRMMLLTDGETVRKKKCFAEAEKAAEDSIPIIAGGIGTDWNEDLLLKIAKQSGGQADYIANAEEIAQHFEDTVQSMQAAVVQNATLTLRLVGGVNPRKIWRVVPLISDLGYKPLSDRYATVPLGGLEKEQGQVILVELMIPPRQAGTYRIAQTELTYDVPSLNLIGEKARGDVILNYTHDISLTRKVTPKVMHIVEKVTAFKLQTRALQEAELGNVAGATQKLRAAVTILLNQGDDELAQTIEKEAEKLEAQGQLSEEGRKTIKFKSMKTVILE